MNELKKNLATGGVFAITITDFLSLYYLGTEPNQKQEQWAPLTDPNYLWMRSWIILASWVRVVRTMLILGNLLLLWQVTGFPVWMLAVAVSFAVMSIVIDMLILSFLGVNPFINTNDTKAVAYPTNWSQDWRCRTIIILLYIRIIPELLGLFS